jgi:hypothetical protein
MYPKKSMTQASPSKTAAGGQAARGAKAAKPAAKAPPGNGAKGTRNAKPAAPAAAAPSIPTLPRGHGRRIQVRRSAVHGKGVFAVAPLARNEVVIEYVGEVITWPEALRRHPHDPSQPDHTFYFHIDDKHVIDGTHAGNASRWINHSCAPNCESDEVGGRIFIRTLRAVKPGDELSFDYRLMIEERYTAKLKKQFQCLCGAKTCRGTMLAPKR